MAVIQNMDELALIVVFVPFVAPRARKICILEWFQSSFVRCLRYKCIKLLSITSGCCFQYLEVLEARHHL